MKTRFEIKYINLQGAFPLLAIIIQWFGYWFVSLILVLIVGFGAHIEIKRVVQKKWKKPALGLTGTQVIF